MPAPGLYSPRTSETSAPFSGAGFPTVSDRPDSCFRPNSSIISTMFRPFRPFRPFWKRGSGRERDLWQRGQLHATSLSPKRSESRKYTIYTTKKGGFPLLCRPKMFPTGESETLGKVGNTQHHVSRAERRELTRNACADFGATDTAMDRARRAGLKMQAYCRFPKRRFPKCAFCFR